MCQFDFLFRHICFEMKCNNFLLSHIWGKKFMIFILITFLKQIVWLISSPKVLRKELGKKNVSISVLSFVSTHTIEGRKIQELILGGSSGPSILGFSEIKKIKNKKKGKKNQTNKTNCSVYTQRDVCQWTKCWNLGLLPLDILNPSRPNPGSVPHSYFALYHFAFHCFSLFLTRQNVIRGLLMLLVS